MPEAEMKFTRLNSRGENPSRTSKLPAGGVVLLVLVGLLAAALIVICSLAVDKAQSNQTIQTLKEENEALRKNLSEEETFLKCEAGWEKHGGNCYYFSTIKSSWNDSRRSCVDQGSDLVKIDSREEQEFLVEKVSQLMKNNEDKFWIGLTDSGEEDEWLWVDGSPLDQSLNFWDYGQPDDLGVYDLPGADCVRMGEKAADRGCDYPQKSICEKTAAAGV